MQLSVSKVGKGGYDVEVYSDLSKLALPRFCRDAGLRHEDCLECPFPICVLDIRNYNNPGTVTRAMAEACEHA
jgi:hypothetical protein